MNPLCSTHGDSVKNGVNIEIALLRWRRSNGYGGVRELTMERIGILLLIDRNGLFAELLYRPDDTAGNFAAVGYQYTFHASGMMEDE